MASFTQYIIRLGLLALIALAALYPPGPAAPRALAQEQPPQSQVQLFLPLVGSSAAPDLIFTPSTIALTPGQVASVKVRVEPQADLRGASFELPGVQEGVSSSFAAAADGRTGTLTIEASTAVVAGERAL